MLPPRASHLARRRSRQNRKLFLNEPLGCRVRARWISSEIGMYCKSGARPVPSPGCCVNGLLRHERKQEKRQRQQSDYPPAPGHAARAGGASAEFFFNKLVVIERFIGKPQVGRGSRLGPASLVVRAAVGTRFCIRRDGSAAVGADLGRPGQVMIQDLRLPHGRVNEGVTGPHSIPAYSSSVSRPRPIKT